MLMAESAAALIFRDGFSPTANTEAGPTGPLAGSGWEHQVYYLDYHGTIISPKHVITARHLGGAGEVLTRPVIFGATEEESYAIKGERILIGETDLAIFEVWETFPSYAELYQGEDEVGREVIIHGTGVDRGAEIIGQGWKWGDRETRRSRWGRNEIKGSLWEGEEGEEGGRDYLYFSFDDLTGQNEVALTRGDSGGGWFIQEGGVWKLAGVSSTVDSHYSQDPAPANANAFRGSFYEASGLAYGTDRDGWEVIPASGQSDDPDEIEFYRQSHSYGSRISRSLNEVEAVIAPALAWEALDATGRFENWLAGKGVTEETGAQDDPDGDGLSNLEEYLTESHPGELSEAGRALRMEILADGSHRIILRESLDRSGRQVMTRLESSADLRQWQEVRDLVAESSTTDPGAGVRTRVLRRAPGSGKRCFYRLRIDLSAPME